MRIGDAKLTSDGYMLATFYGTSLEDKPTDKIAMGSTFIEVDTGKVFLYNETASSWVEQGA